MLVRNADTHSRSTRHSSVNLVCPRYKRASEGGRTFQVLGTKLWNTKYRQILGKRNHITHFTELSAHITTPNSDLLTTWIFILFFYLNFYL
jgi:hypothetical protein